MTADSRQPQHRSYLFTVRLWLEDLSDGRTEWRGEVHQVTTGQSRYFRDWPSLAQALLTLLGRDEATERAHPSEHGAPPEPGGA